MRNSAVGSQRYRSQPKERQPLVIPLSPRRYFGELNNLNKPPLYTASQSRYPNGQVSSQQMNFPRPTVWTSRVNDQFTPQNAFYRRTSVHNSAQQTFEPSHSYGSLQNARQMSMGLTDIRKSQAVAPIPREQSVNRQRQSSAASEIVTPNNLEARNVKSPASNIHQSLNTMVGAKPDNKQTASLSGSIVRSPSKPKQPDMPPPPYNITPFRFQFSYRSKKGFIPNVIKENQDICVVSANINGRPWEHFFAVCDGHGASGHHISAFIRNHFLTHMGKAQYFHKKPQENLYLAFKAAIEGLTRESFDVSTSGSTVVSCYLYKESLFCANVGDSRAVMGSKDPTTGKWTARQLSNDHKPSVPSEAQRIWRCNGRVEPLKDQRGYPMGPLRVWLQSSQIPGLAMTRSVGDLVASPIGVTWYPEVTEHIISVNDKILILASDGVWEFLSNYEVIAKLAPFYESGQLYEASKFLMEYSTTSWNNNMPMVDDISFVVLFLSHDD